MAKVRDWFERNFEFSFPVELYPDICMRLRGTPARLEELVGGCRRESMLRAPQGKWSAQEHAGHLADLEPLWMARVEDYLGGRGELAAADLTNRRTDQARHNEHPLPQILADFRRARLELARVLDQLDASLFARVSLHPRLKTPLRLVDHMFFVAEHDDHHLALIWSMIRNR